MARTPKTKPQEVAPSDESTATNPNPTPEPVAPQPNRQGPEDALGNEPTMHDYSDRLGDADYRPHQGEVPQTPSTPEG